MCAIALQNDGWFLRDDIILATPIPMPATVHDRPVRSHGYLFLLSKEPRYYYDALAFQERSCDSAVLEWRNCRDVWTIAPDKNPELHYAVFAKEMVQRCVLAGSRVGDLVLDPFVGSGIVGDVAEQLGRRWIGLELSADYVRIAKRKTRQMGMLLPEVRG